VHKPLKSSRLAAAAVLLMMSGLAVVVAAPVALAHAELISASPKEGQVLKKAPTEVVLTFGEDVLEQGSAVVVTGPDGQRYDQKSTLTAAGNTVTVQLDPATASGAYEVALRVVSADGHVVNEVYNYTLTLKSSPSATPSASPSASPSLTAPTTSPIAAEPTSDDGGSLVWVLGAAAIGLALVAALVAVFVRKRSG
jgi:copper resistance protein C